MSAWTVNYTIGDQGPLKWKFDASRMEVCPRCSGTDIAEEKYPTECRMNGDACGATVFTCRGCSWATSFLWDDATDPYYYEKPPVSVATTENPSKDSGK
jgi:hypothetical protein